MTFNGLGLHLGNLSRLFMRSSAGHPLPYKEVYTILGRGGDQFYMDGDAELPTLCGTGTEDYFFGSCLPQIIRPGGDYQSQTRFGMYRWHIMDPIRFESDLRVTIQARLALGQLGQGTKYLPLKDDISSGAYWYQTLPTAAFPTLPDKDDLEVI